MNGTTGEGIHSLTVDERLELTESWMKQKEKVPHIFVQVGGTNFTEAKILVTLRHPNKALKTVTFLLRNYIKQAVGNFFLKT